MTDIGGTSKDKSNEACVGLAAFMKETGCEKESVVRDMLASMMHYCHQNDVDFQYELDIARDFFHGELEEEAELEASKSANPSSTPSPGR